MIYQVVNWRSTFENNKSRQWENCSYVCVPNKQHGMGLTRILSEPDGIAIYGIWQLILGAVSRQGKHRDGWLTDDGHCTGTAWTPQDLALIWRCKESDVARALEVLCNPRIGWINKFEPEVTRLAAVVSASESNGIIIGDRSAREVPAKCPSGSLEQNRTEQNRILASAAAEAESVTAVDGIAKKTEAIEHPDAKTNSPKRNRREKPDRATNPDHAILRRSWMAEYKPAHGGDDYIFKGGKDAAAISALLLTGLPVEQIMRIAKEAWKHPTEFNSKQAASISGFYSRLNEIRDELNSIRVHGSPKKNGADHKAANAHREYAMRPSERPTVIDLDAPEED